MTLATGIASHSILQIQRSRPQTLTNWPARVSVLPMPIQPLLPAPHLALWAAHWDQSSPDRGTQHPARPWEGNHRRGRERRWEISSDPKGTRPTWLGNGTWALTIPTKRKTSGPANPCPEGPSTGDSTLFLALHSSAGSDPLCFIENDRYTAKPSNPLVYPKFDIKGGSRSITTDAATGFSIEQSSPILLKRALSLIKDHAQRKEGRPFFLYYASPIPHQPWVPMSKFEGKSGLGPYGDFVMQMDWVVGQINDSLKKTGLDKNTMLIFTSDNGVSPVAHKMMHKQKGHESSEKFRGMKAFRYEGGHRVPFHRQMARQTGWQGPLQNPQSILPISSPPLPSC